MQVTGSSNEQLKTNSTGRYLVTITGDLRIASVTGSVYSTIFTLKDSSGITFLSWSVGPELMNGGNARTYVAGDHYLISKSLIVSINTSKPLKISAKTNDTGTTIVPAWSSVGVGTETRMGNPLIVTMHKL
jgi:hypothetical protein